MVHFVRQQWSAECFHCRCCQWRPKRSRYVVWATQILYWSVTQPLFGTDKIPYAMPMMPTIWFSLFYVQVLFHFFLAPTMKKEKLSTFPFRLVSYALDDQEWEEKVSSEWFSWDCTTDTWEVQWLPSSLAHLLMISMTLWTMIWDKNK